METLQKRISSVFNIVLPVGEGSGKSVDDPVQVHVQEEGAYEDLLSRWLHFKSVLEEKKLVIIRTVPILHHGKNLVRIDLQSRSESITSAFSRIEHLYFDISECIKSVDCAQIAIEWPDIKLEWPPLFSSIDDYLDFYLDEEELEKSLEIETARLTLRKIDSQKWSVQVECRKANKSVGDFIKPFKPIPENLERFHQGCLVLAKQLALFAAAQEAPHFESPFGDWATE